MTFRDARVIGWTMVAYALFVVVGTLFEPLLLIWPHLFLLATQHLTGPPDDYRTVIALLLGSFPVCAVAVLWQRRRRPRHTDEVSRELLFRGFLTTLVALGSVTLLAFALAWLLGWEVGV